MAATDPINGTAAEPIAIINISDKFDSEAQNLWSKLEQATAAIQSDASSPGKLADYQKALSAYTLYRNAQSNTTKAIKDIASATIANFR